MERSGSESMHLGVLLCLLWAQWALPSKWEKKSSVGSPVTEADHRVSATDLRAVSTNNKQSWTELGRVPKKTSHTWTHTMGEGKRGKSAQKNKQRRRRWGKVWLHADDTTLEYLRHKSLPVWPRNGVPLSGLREGAVTEGALLPQTEVMALVHAHGKVGCFSAEIALAALFEHM